MFFLHSVLLHTTEYIRIVIDRKGKTRIRKQSNNAKTRKKKYQNNNRTTQSLLNLISKKIREKMVNRQKKRIQQEH